MKTKLINYRNDLTFQHNVKYASILINVLCIEYANDNIEKTCTITCNIISNYISFYKVLKMPKHLLTTT